MNIVPSEQGPTSECISHPGRVSGAARYCFRVGNQELSSHERWPYRGHLRECADVAHEQSESTVAMIKGLKGAIRVLHSLLRILSPYIDGRESRQ